MNRELRFRRHELTRVDIEEYEIVFRALASHGYRFNPDTYLCLDKLVTEPIDFRRIATEYAYPLHEAAGNPVPQCSNGPLEALNGA